MLPDGWIIEHEHPPSTNRHKFPTGQGHMLTNECWCKPELFGSAGYTLVVHRDKVDG